MTKEEKEEIRAVVASELQDVLRQEMAQWWAESVLAVSSGGQANQAAGAAGAGSHSPQSHGAGQTGSGTRGDAVDIEHLARIASSLARTQEITTRDMESSMKRIRSILDELDQMAEKLEGRLTEIE